LDLSVNFSQTHGTQAIAAMLVSPVPLKRLDISCQDVWDNRDYFIYICDALSNPKCRLEVLDIHSNFLQDSHLEWFLQGLQSNQTLEKVVLCDNLITDVGMANLSGSLPKLSSSFQSLGISNNSYSVEAIRALELGLSNNVFLRELKVDSPTTILSYFLALNHGGRFLKLPNKIGVTLWPSILERTNHCLSAEHSSFGICSADIIFDLLHGPALFDQ
jgi:hypothetical protein